MAHEGEIARFNGVCLPRREIGFGKLGATGRSHVMYNEAKKKICNVVSLVFVYAGIISNGGGGRSTERTIHRAVLSSGKSAVGAILCTTRVSTPVPKNGAEAYRYQHTNL